MKKILRYISPLSTMAIILIVWAIIIMLQHKPSDVEGWDVVMAFGLLFYALIILVVHFITLLIKHKQLWWVIQSVLAISVLLSLIYPYIWK